MRTNDIYHTLELWQILSPDQGKKEGENKVEQDEDRMGEESRR